MERILSIIPKWSTLKICGQSPLSRILVLMPVIGYLLIFSENINNYLALSAQMLNITADRAATLGIQNLYLLFFGLLLFSIASLIFSLCCPEIIKAFINRYEYREREFQYMTESHLHTILAQDHHRDLHISPDNIDTDPVQRLSNRQNQGNQAHWRTSNSVVIIDTLDANFDREDRKWPALRFIISVVFAMSFVLIAIPNLKIIVTVLTSIFQ